MVPKVLAVWLLRHSGWFLGYMLGWTLGCC